MTTPAPPTQRHFKKAAFITFYSFKGGVGRTMSLVSVACILAGRGRRVLMLDFDLEAPGLTYLVHKLASSTEMLGNPVNSSSHLHVGLIEFIKDCLNADSDSPLSDESQPMFFHEKYIESLQLPFALKIAEGGVLDLLGSGYMDSDFANRLHSINFSDLYSKGLGQPLFALIKNLIINSNLYDYVLIDSRTGFSDEGGICTGDLADHIVVLTGLNRQNLQGTQTFLSHLSNNGWKKTHPTGKIVCVASPVPLGDDELCKQRMEETKSIFQETGFGEMLPPNKALPFIPYHPRLSLDEDPFSFNWSETRIFPYYRRVEELVRELCQDDLSHWSQQLSEIIELARYNEIPHFLKQIHYESPETSEAFFNYILNTFIQSKRRLQQNIDLIRMLFEIRFQHDDEPDEHLRFADVLVQADFFGEAEIQANIALDKYKIADNHEKQAEALQTLAVSYWHRDIDDLTLQTFKQCRELSMQFKLSDIWLFSSHSIAHVLADQGNFLQAIDIAQDILDRLDHEDIEIESPSVEQKTRIEAGHLPEEQKTRFENDINRLLAQIYAQQGNLNQAFTLLNQIRQTRRPENEDERGSYFDTWRIEAYICNLRGDYEELLQNIPHWQSWFKNSDDRDDEALADLILEQAITYQCLKDYEKAKSLIESALEEGRKCLRGNSFEIFNATVLAQRGKIEAALGNVPIGLNMISQAVGTFERYNRPVREISSRILYIDVLMENRRHSQAISYADDQLNKLSSEKYSHYHTILKAIKVIAKIASGQISDDDIVSAQECHKYFYQQAIHTLRARQIADLLKTPVAGSSDYSGNIAYSYRSVYSFIKEFDRILRSLDFEYKNKMLRALDDTKEEIAKEQPNEVEIRNSIERALSYARHAKGFAAIAPLLTRRASNVPRSMRRNLGLSLIAVNEKEAKTTSRIR